MTHPNYSTAFYLALIFGAFFLAQHLDNRDNRHEWPESDNLQAIQQEESARASREFAGQAVCGPGALAQWDGDVLSCFPKRGKSYQVAKGTP